MKKRGIKSFIFHFSCVVIPQADDSLLDINFKVSLSAVDDHVTSSKAFPLS
jgi:hypothetical protein